LSACLHRNKCYLLFIVDDDVYRRCYGSNLLAALQKDCSYSSHFDCR